MLMQKLPAVKNRHALVSNPPPRMSPLQFPRCNSSKTSPISLSLTPFLSGDSMLGERNRKMLVEVAQQRAHQSPTACSRSVLPYVSMLSLAADNIH